MSQITEGDKELVTEIMLECCRKIAALIEGDFIHSIEIDMDVNGENYKLLLTKTKEQ